MECVIISAIFLSPILVFVAMHYVDKHLKRGTRAIEYALENNEIDGFRSDSALIAEYDWAVAVDANRDTLCVLFYNKEVERIYRYIYSYKDISGCSVIVDGHHSRTHTTSTKSTSNMASRALVGGSIFGATGAVVGAMTARRDYKSHTNHTVNYIGLRIQVRDPQHPAHNVPIIERRIDYGSLLYKKSVASAEQMQAIIEYMIQRQRDERYHEDMRKLATSDFN